MPQTFDGLSEISGGTVIGHAGDSTNGGEEAILSLVFANGARPDAEAVAGIEHGFGWPGSYTVSHRPDPAEGWLELLASGLTFDCGGLAPAPAGMLPPRGALLGLDTAPMGEAIWLAPGAHIAAGRGLLPIVRVLAGIGSRLATLPELKAVCWQPAGSWMEPGYFRRVVQDWLDGGAFPALGLTSLRRESNGAMVSLGLGLLIGQELRFEPERALPAATIARISVRLIHELIASGPLLEPHEFQGPNGEALLAVPVRDGQQLRVMVRK